LVPSPNFYFVDEEGKKLEERIANAASELYPRFAARFGGLARTAVVEDLFEQAARNVAEYERARGAPVKDLGAFSWRVIFNRAVSLLRRNRRELPLHETGRACAAAEGSEERIEQALRLQQILMKLDPLAVEIALLKKQGFSSAEIAKAKGLTVSNVDTIMSRARARLRDLERSSSDPT
jgi:RNA polymerase sigma factor (sigma-70 family)